MRNIDVNNVIENSKFNNFFFIITGLLSLVVIFDGYDMGIYGVTLPLIMKELSLTATQVGFLASAGMVGMMIGALFFGSLADVIGRKKIIIIGIFIYSVFNGLVGFIHSALIFAVLRFIAGLGMGAITPVIVSLVSEYSPKVNRTLIISLVVLGIPIGQLLASLAGVAFLSTQGWRVFYYATFISLIVMFLIISHIPESMKFYVAKGKTNDIKKALSKADPQFVFSDQDVYRVSTLNSEKASIISLFEKKYVRNTILIWIVFFCNLYLFFGVSTWLPKLMTIMGYTLTSSIAFLGIFLVGSIIGGIVFGILGDKLGYKALLSLVYIASAILVSLLSFKTNMVLFYILLFLAGATVSSAQNLTLAIVPEFYPISIRGTAMGWGSAISRLGSAVAPIIIGILVQVNFSMPLVFESFIIPAIIGCVAILLTKKD
ncbi:MFS transporter [Clostridium sp. WLY-B-L2]|uniref:MFS transporter n=1 Tax=Clostridium aromativorans TaxID=2836848 RepID=A0ABS8NA40_9CLOT|nr:MFS transporter [Clostridium aromativorans]MCC9296666.1 MFS transporter [Clostridium aromativorans]